MNLGERKGKKDIYPKESKNVRLISDNDIANTSIALQLNVKNRSVYMWKSRNVSIAYLENINCFHIM